MSQSRAEADWNCVLLGCMWYPIPSCWSVSCSIGFLSVSCCFLASLLKGGFRPIQVTLTPGSAWHQCLSPGHSSVSECPSVRCISHLLTCQATEIQSQGLQPQCPSQGCQGKSQRRRARMEPAPIFAWLPGPGLSAGTSPCPSVLGFGATLDKLPPFGKQGRTSHLHVKDRHEVPLVFVKFWIFSSSGDKMEQLPWSFISLCYL